MTTSKPTNKFKIPTKTVLLGIDGAPLFEYVLDKYGKPTDQTKEITLGTILSNAMLSEKRTEGITMINVDRFRLAQRFRGAVEPEIKVSVCEQVKKIVDDVYGNSALISGQALMLLGDEPSKDCED